jgi:hypothetical protein
VPIWIYHKKKLQILTAQLYKILWHDTILTIPSMPYVHAYKMKVPNSLLFYNLFNSSFAYDLITCQWTPSCLTLRSFQLLQAANEPSYFIISWYIFKLTTMPKALLTFWKVSACNACSVVHVFWNVNQDGGQ